MEYQLFASIQTVMKKLTEVCLLLAEVSHSQNSDVIGISVLSISAILVSSVMAQMKSVTMMMIASVRSKSYVKDVRKVKHHLITSQRHENGSYTYSRITAGERGEKRIQRRLQN